MKIRWKGEEDFNPHLTTEASNKELLYTGRYIAAKVSSSTKHHIPDTCSCRKGNQQLHLENIPSPN